MAGSCGSAGCCGRAEGGHDGLTVPADIGKGFPHGVEGLPVEITEHAVVGIADERVEAAQRRIGFPREADLDGAAVGFGLSFFKKPGGDELPVMPRRAAKLSRMAAS
jgi:hypothetical protein